MSDSPTPSSEIVRFFRSLPATISSDILVFVAMYAVDYKPAMAPKEDFLAPLELALTTGGWARKMGAALRVIGVTDYVIERAASKIRSAKVAMASAAAQHLDPEIVSRLLAGHPMRQRHYDKALADWKILRTGPLSHSNLSDYEDNLLIPRNPGQRAN